MLLHDPLVFRARTTPDDIVLRDGVRTWTARQLDEAASALAGHLTEQGLGHGDRVAVLANNCFEYLACYFGLAKGGFVTVPLNQRLAPPEWASILADSGSRAIVARGPFVAAVNAALDDVPACETRVAMEGRHPGWVDWDQALANAAPLTRTFDDGDVGVQMYTSGTTGRPKGALLTHRGLVESVMASVMTFPHAIHGCSHLVAPVAHIGAALAGILSITTGGSIYMQEEFDPFEVVRILDEEGIQRTTLVPAMIQALLTLVPDVADRAYEDLRLVQYGASPIAPDVLRRATEVFKCDFLQAYGQTESGGALTMLLPSDHRRALAGEERRAT